MCFSCACKDLAISGYDKFGRRTNKGRIAFRKNKKDLEQILYADDSRESEASWANNLSAKRFMERYGQAVATDPHLQPGQFEWIRRVKRKSGVHEILCCPEDVVKTRACRHDATFVCPKCEIPFCDECYFLSLKRKQLPRCLANDNVIGYVHAYIVEKKVTWLEATIACPVFTGLVTYFVEGRAHERGHMMKEPLARPQRAWAVRGNLFSFLLPWDRVMQQLSKCWLTGDFSEWPLDENTACEICRIRFVKGHTAVVDNYAELKVRSQVVKNMAKIYIDRHVHDLGNRGHILKLHPRVPEGTVRERLHNHIDLRVDEIYPSSEFDVPCGAVPEKIRLASVSGAPDRSCQESLYEMKQSTMPDTPNDELNVFHGVRPTIVLDEGEASNTFSQETLLQAGAPKVAGLDVKMSNEFQDQFISQYIARCFPWALNYDCGGADYPDLFADWESMEKSLGSEATHHLKARWRRFESSASLLPGPYAKMLASRPELQVSGDWMLVPAARNLHWRYAVLRSAFVNCKQSLHVEESMAENLDALLDALTLIWKKIEKNTAVVQKKTMPINGNLELLFKDDEVNAHGRNLLRSYLQCTKSIAGCQALRKRIGQILFGFRCVYGEVVFFTISPNRRHSALLLRLSRARENDVMLKSRNRSSTDRDENVAYWRHRYCSHDAPAAFSEDHIGTDPSGENVLKEIELPDVFTRQAWISQDPLASVHNYQVMMYVVLSAAFGVRMCLHCPDCNADVAVFSEAHESCSDYLGNNHKSMGGYALDGATAMIMAISFYREVRIYIFKFSLGASP